MKKTLWSISSALICAFCGVLTVFSETASDAASSSLSMCIACLIPSLFPYMVASSMLVSCGAAERISKYLPVSRIFGLPRHTSGVIILGALCGFPLGAKAAVELYKKGAVTKSEAEALIAVANNTGPSFVVAVIGAGFWHSAAFGWKLYFLQMIGALAAGIFINRIAFPVSSEKLCKPTPGDHESFPVIFSRAVVESVGAVLGVCGFVMFFSVLCAYIRTITDAFSPVLTGAVLSVLELTGAAEYSAAAAATGMLSIGGFFAGFALGFSGLSVFCQSAAFAIPESLSLKRTFALKLIQGVICGAGGAVLASFENIPTVLPAISIPTVPCIVCVVFFAFLSLNCARKA